MEDEKFKDLLEDEELTSLRLAALASKQKLQQTSHDANNIGALPINSIVSSSAPASEKLSNQIPFVQSDRNTFHVNYSWRKQNQPSRRRGGAFSKSNQRSNLIVISPVALNEGKDTEEKAPALVLPQHKWCNSGNEDSMSPKTLRKTGPTRFNRHGSDSESSESDYENEHDSGSNETVLQDEPPEPFSRLSPDSDSVSETVEKKRRLSFQNLESEMNPDTFDKSETTTIYNLLRQPSQDSANGQPEHYASVQNPLDGHCAWNHSVENKYNSYNKFNRNHSYASEPLDPSKNFVAQEINSSIVNNGEPHIETSSFITQSSDTSAWPHSETKSDNSYYSREASSVPESSRNCRIGGRQSKNYSEKRRMSDDGHSSTSAIWQHDERFISKKSSFVRDTVYDGDDHRNYKNESRKMQFLTQGDLRLELKKRMQEMKSKSAGVENHTEKIENKEDGQNNMWEKDRDAAFSESVIKDISYSSSYENKLESLNTLRNRIGRSFSQEREFNSSDKRHHRSLSQERNKRGRLGFGSSSESRYNHSPSQGRSRRERSSSRSGHERSSSRSSHERSTSRSRHKRSTSRNRYSRSNSRSRNECSTSRNRRERSTSRNRQERSSSRSRREHSASRSRRECSTSRCRHERSTSRSRRERSTSRSRRERSTSRSRRERSTSRSRRERSTSRSRRERSTSRSRHERSASRSRQARSSSRKKNERSSSRSRRERSSSRKRNERSSSRSRRERSSSRKRNERSSSRGRYEHSPNRNKHERSSSRSRLQRSTSRGPNEHSSCRDTWKNESSLSQVKKKDEDPQDPNKWEVSSSPRKNKQESNFSDEKDGHSWNHNKNIHDHSFSPDRNKKQYTSSQNKPKSEWNSIQCRSWYKCSPTSDSKHGHSLSQERNTLKEDQADNRREFSSSQSRGKRAGSQDLNQEISPSRGRSRLVCSSGDEQVRSQHKCNSKDIISYIKHNSYELKNNFDSTSSQDKNKTDCVLNQELLKECIQIKKSEKIREVIKFDRNSTDEKSKSVERNRFKHSSSDEGKIIGEKISPRKSFRANNSLYRKSRYSRSRSSSSSSCSSSYSSSSHSSKPKLRSVSSVIKSVQPKSLEALNKETRSCAKNIKFNASQSDVSLTSSKKNIDGDYNKLSSVKSSRTDANFKAGDGHKRVPVHMRLGAMPRNRVMQMPKDVEAAFVNSSSSSDDENVNTKCKRQNIRIVTDVLNAKSRLDPEKNQPTSETSTKRSPDLQEEKSKRLKIKR